MTIRVILVLLMCVSGFSKAEIVTGKDGKDVVSVPSSQEKMILAMQKGVATIDNLFDSLQSGNQAHSRHGIKIGYTENGKTEYLWLYELGVNKQGLYGVLANTPYYAKQVKAGDVISIKPEDVVDWSYVENGVLVGGYTLRVMFEQYNAEQKIEIQKQLGYKILPE